MLATLILSCAAIASRVMPSAATANVGALGASRWRPAFVLAFASVRPIARMRNAAHLASIRFTIAHSGDGAPGDRVARLFHREDEDQVRMSTLYRDRRRR